MTPSDSHHDRHVEALLAAARSGAVPSIEHGVESERTPEEQALLEARLRQARALVALGRRPAPLALEGYVVAAMQAGAREERAVAAVRDLGTEVAPVELDERVAGSIDRLRAPGALDLYVAGRLALPGAGLAQSLLARLPRLAAPEDLTARLAAPGSAGSSGHARAGLDFVAPYPRGLLGRIEALGSTRKITFLVAAALLLFALAGRFGSAGDALPSSDRELSDWSQPSPHRPPSPRDLDRIETIRPRVELTFEFVAYESHLAAPLTPELRALVSGLVGEMLEGGS
jgi:hypothetical protein